MEQLSPTRPSTSAFPRAGSSRLPRTPSVPVRSTCNDNAPTRVSDEEMDGDWVLHHAAEIAGLASRTLPSTGGSGNSCLMDITVTTLAGMRYMLNKSMETTVKDFKVALQREMGMAPAQQRLIYGGRELEDGQTLSQAKISAGVTMHLLERPKRRN